MAAFTVLEVIPPVTSLILIVSSLALYLAYYLKTKYTYWERRGVPNVKPVHLIFGNTKDLILQRVPVSFIFERFYKVLDGHKFGGIYQLTKPLVIIRDPELIKAVFVKNFSNFHDRTTEFVNEKTDPLSSHLLNLCGQRWKNIRYKLTPTFSSGKLRQMEPLMKECIGELEAYLAKATSGDVKTGDVLNVRELMAKFTTDVIGTCAFGFKCNSISDEDSEFRRIGRLIFKPTYRVHIRSLLRTIYPRLISLLKIKSLNPEVEDFFKSVLEQAIKHRESNAQKRNDFLQLMIDIQAEEKANLQINGHQENDHLQNEHQKNGHQNGSHVEKSKQDEKTGAKTSEILFTESIVASNAFVFFIAGFETTASTLSYCLYELALNPEVCEKMKDEVESVMRAHNGNLDYNALKELVYMDAVISETLRKHPVASVLGRRCTEPFQIPGSSVVIEKGTPIVVSVYGLHHDPKYFPEPEKFLPERFSEENKDSIVPGSYLPFGDGPRICIGMRFAQFEMKSVLSHLVTNYTFHPCEKTVIPLKIDRRSGLLTPLGGIWVQIKKRSKL